MGGGGAVPCLLSRAFCRVAEDLSLQAWRSACASVYGGLWELAAAMLILKATAGARWKPVFRDDGKLGALVQCYFPRARGPGRPGRPGSELCIESLHGLGL